MWSTRQVRRLRRRSQLAKRWHSESPPCGSDNLKKVSRPLARFRPSRRYFLFGLLGLAGTLFSAWSGSHWPLTWIAAGIFGLSTLFLGAMALRPAIEIHESHLQIGRKLV